MRQCYTSGKHRVIAIRKAKIAVLTSLLDLNPHADKIEKYFSVSTIARNSEKDSKTYGTLSTADVRMLLRPFVVNGSVKKVDVHHLDQQGHPDIAVTSYSVAFGRKYDLEERLQSYRSTL